ncbi:MAG: metallophosphoesterase family protein [Promethearchaeia archaeon]
MERNKFKSVFTKKNFLSFLKRLLLTILIISPILLFMGGIYLNQLSLPDEKQPFTYFSGKDPKTQAIISWETSQKYESVLWYGPEENQIDEKIEYEDESSIHNILLNNLTPDTRYFYQVGMRGDDAEYKSEVSTFKTAPNETDKNFDFIAYSDSQQYYGIGWHSRISKAIGGYNDLSFVTNVGDLCQNYDCKPDWNQFFAEADAFMKKFLFVPSLGNHDGFYEEDKENHYYLKYFGDTLEEDTFYYSFNWSNTFFTVGEISKRGDEDPNDSRNIAHDSWLNSTLENAQNKRFRILMFHRQMFSAEDNNEVLIDRIVPIVEEYNVSLVLYGHHHHYERFLYKGTTYLCLGGGGGQQFGSNALNTGEYSKALAMGPSYTHISVSSDKLVLTTYSVENDIIDKYTIK